jgi:hypothetical protein
VHFWLIPLINSNTCKVFKFPSWIKGNHFFCKSVRLYAMSAKTTVFMSLVELIQLLKQRQTFLSASSKWCCSFNRKNLIFWSVYRG